MSQEESDTCVGEERRYRESKATAVRIWALIGGVIVFVLALGALGMVGAAVECLLVGIIVGFMCSPITNWLEDHHVGRAGGALIALLVVVGIAVGVLLVLVPAFTEQLLNLIEHIPGYFTQIQQALSDLWANYGDASTAGLQSNVADIVSTLSSATTNVAQDFASQITSGLIPNVMNAVNALVMGFLGLVVAYWLAKDYPTIIREFAVIAGPDKEHDLTLLFAVMSRSMGGYMRSILITSLINGLLSFVGFALIGHPYAGLMGVLTGIMHFIPVIGPWVSAALAVVIALFVNPALAFWTLVVAVVAQNVTDNVISPLVMQSAVKVHPVMTLVAITIGASLGGALGMAVAVPLSAAIKGVFVYYFERSTGRQLVSYDGALFKSTPYHHPDGAPSPTLDALDDPHFFESSRLAQQTERPTIARTERPKGVKPTLAELLHDRVEEHAADEERAARTRRGDTMAASVGAATPPPSTVPKPADAHKDVKPGPATGSATDTDGHAVPSDEGHDQT